MTPLLVPPVAAGDPVSHILPHTLWRVGDYGITNHLVMLVLAAVLLLVFVPVLARGSGLVPRGARNFFESILQFVREQVARPVLGEHVDHYIPFLWTVFLLILTANLLGMIPLGAAMAPIDAHLEHMGGTATGNFSITVGLALCAFFYLHWSGIKAQGLGHYFANLAPHGVPWPVLILLYPLEILGALVKAFALAIRLFANMIAGHIVLSVILGFAVFGLQAGGASYAITLVSVLGAVAMSLLEVFVALLQAYVFTFLTTLFIGMAVHPEH
jgi:F-type H+-transporting ATPase subunit a